MERGLLWLPLLGVFGILAGLGWIEYRKVETYRQWASQFERAKYDVLAVLGWRGPTLTWGIPTPQGPTHLQSVDLSELTDIQLWVDGQPVHWPLESSLPQGRQIQLLLLPLAVRIPFTEVELALRWWGQLKAALVPNVEVNSRLNDL